MTTKAYKFRAYPNKTTEKLLEGILLGCQKLYNLALEQRINYYLATRKSINYLQQQNELPDFKEAFPEYKEIASHVLQDVLLRLHKAYADFFRRVKNGGAPGFPRFKGRNRYDSFTYPDIAGWKFAEHDGKAHLVLSKIGTIRVKAHRPLPSEPKSCQMVREGKHWYVVFMCEEEVKPLPVSHNDVGIDMGINHFIFKSDGTQVDNPRHYRMAEEQLKKCHQAISNKPDKKSHRRAKAIRVLAKTSRKVANQRKDFHRKVAKEIVDNNQVIVAEDLSVKNMTKKPKPKKNEQGEYIPNGAAAKAGLNKSIQDAGWGNFIRILNAKAAEAGRTMILVNPAYTSQMCSGCGKICPKSLKERWHICTCGTELDRDYNASINILHKGMAMLESGWTPPKPKPKGNMFRKKQTVRKESTSL